MNEYSRTNGQPLPAPGGQPLSITWSGTPWGLAGLSLVNFLLTIVTLGIYSFWGRTEVRRRIWSSIRLADEPLVYTGTGMELFLGFLIAMFGVFLPLTLLLIGAYFAFGPGSLGWGLSLTAFYIVLFFLVGIAIYRALRYRLSRTRWRGIRGALTGSSLRFAWTYVWTAVLSVFTLGWLTPWRAVHLQRIMINNMRFGSQPLRFDGSSGGLYGPFAVAWIGTVVLYVLLVAAIVAVLWPNIQAQAEAGHPIPPDAGQTAAIIGLSVLSGVLIALLSAWYSARFFNVIAEGTSFSNARFEADVTAGGLIWLVLSNMLIIVLSLTILTPVAQARAARYIVEHLVLTGTVDTAAIAQSTESLSRTGEGLAQAFDVDVF